MASTTHSDGSFYDGWFICGMTLPTGQVSFHLPDRLWAVAEQMGIDKNNEPEWDGHTVEDVASRLADWAKG